MCVIRFLKHRVFIKKTWCVQGELEEFTFRRKVFDGYPMPEKTLIKVNSKKVSLIKQLNNSFLFGADAFRGNTRSHPEHDG